MIWVVVAGLNVATILAFSDEPDPWAKAWKPAALGLAVPAIFYLVLWGWNSWRRKGVSGEGEP